MIFTPRIGFRSGAGGGDIILLITSNVNAYDIFSNASLIGSPGSAAGGRKVIVRLSNGVIVGGNNVGSQSAMKTGTGWGSGWAVDIEVPSGTARIQGYGGRGAIGRTRGNIVGPPGEQECSPNGTQDGGGGGGAGTPVGAGGASGGQAGTSTAGGAGGAGNGTGNCTISNGSAATSGGHALEATSGGPNISLKPAAGATLQVWGGAGGGGSSASGGGPGQPGNGSSPGTNGKAYYTPGAATITEVGPGTIDDRGV